MTIFTPSLETQAIQQALVAAGFNPGHIDGVMGPKTAKAIIAFKRSIGLRPRTYVGPLTWAALQTAASDQQSGNASAADFDAQDLPWIVHARRVLGLHEEVHNSKLREWLKSDGHALGDPAVLPWCGDFVETSIRLGLPNEKFVGKLAENPYWALNWQQFGRSSEPTFGAVASIKRKGGGHVGFVVGEDKQHYFLLGGNQSNTVSIAPKKKSRFTEASFRWPSTFKRQPANLPWLKSAGNDTFVEA
tara:strand:- start:870 stop:1607 length:738 start_codon:yes stop_codon:yes gene_type:complete